MVEHRPDDESADQPRAADMGAHHPLSPDDSPRPPLLRGSCPQLCNISIVKTKYLFTVFTTIVSTL